MLVVELFFSKRQIRAFLGLQSSMIAPFFFSFFFLSCYAQVATLEYLWRLDDDSYLLTPIAEDPFASMKNSGHLYAFRSDFMILSPRSIEVGALPQQQSHEKSRCECAPGGRWQHTPRTSLYLNPVLCSFLSYFRSFQFDLSSSTGIVEVHRRVCSSAGD
jgi:hypothetical protein